MADNAPQIFSGQSDAPLPSGEGPGEHLIFKTSDFVVFLDRDLELDWVTTTEFENKFDFGDTAKVLRQVALLNSMPIDHLTISHKKSLRRMLGEAMALALQDEVGDAERVLDDAGKFLQARNRDCSRGWFLQATFVLTGTTVILVVALWLGRDYLRPQLGLILFNLLIAASAGVIGATASVIQRLPNVTLDPVSGKFLHQVEAMGRVIIGGVFATIAFLAIESGQLLPKIADNTGLIGICLFCLIAGFSERFIPSFIAKLDRENGVNRKHRK